MVGSLENELSEWFLDINKVKYLRLNMGVSEQF